MAAAEVVVLMLVPLVELLNLGEMVAQVAALEKLETPVLHQLVVEAVVIQAKPLAQVQMGA